MYRQSVESEISSFTSRAITCAKYFRCFLGCQWVLRTIFEPCSDSGRKHKVAINKSNMKSRCENLFNGSFVISDLCQRAQEVLIIVFFLGKNLFNSCENVSPPKLSFSVWSFYRARCCCLFHGQKVLNLLFLFHLILGLWMSSAYVI